MIGQMIDRFRVVAQLGEGGMGAVYEALDEQNGQRVAIKVLHKEHVSNQQIALRFINEARAINVVDHPGIVQVSTIGQLPDGTAYIVMELLKGETLSARMKRSPGSKLPVLDCIRLGKQIASALAAAHAKSIVHRDLKPDNIMIVADPAVPGAERTKLLDFGIAKVKQEYQANDQLQTRAGVMMGTPLYMSPEQCKNAGDVDDKADVYSLGVMLYRMLSGKPPFSAAGTGELMAMHIYMQPQPLKEHDAALPDPIVDLVHRMLAKQRQDRPSMSQVEQDLEKINVKVSAMVPAIKLSGPPLPAVPVQTGPVQAEAKTVLSDGSGYQIPVPKGGDGATVMPTGSAAASGGGNRTVRVALVAVVTLLVLAASAGVVGWLQKRSQVKLDPSDPKSMAQTVDKLVQGANGTGPHPAKSNSKIVAWHIESSPSGAEVYQLSKDELLGKTPLRIEQPIQPGEVQVELRLTGYLPKRITLACDRDQEPPVVKLDQEKPEPVDKGKKGKGKSRRHSKK
jgi:serine/threonine-protein kinase